MAKRNSKNKPTEIMDDDMPPLDPTELDGDDDREMSPEMATAMDAAQNMEALPPGEYREPSEPPFRPSDLHRLVKEEYPNGLPEGMKLHHFSAERGLPIPVRLYRVSVAGKRQDSDYYRPVEVNAVDEPDAINKALNRWKVRQAYRHRITCTVVCLEQ